MLLLVARSPVLNPNLRLHYLFQAMTVHLSTNTAHKRRVRQRCGTCSLARPMLLLLPAPPMLLLLPAPLMLLLPAPLMLLLPTPPPLVMVGCGRGRSLVVVG